MNSETPTAPRSRSSLWVLALVGILGLFSWLASKPNRLVSRKQDREPEEPPNGFPPDPKTVPERGWSSRCNYPTPPWWKGPAEIVALLVAIGLLIVTIRQSRSTQRAAEAAVDGVKATRDSMQADERAWVGISDPVGVRVAPQSPGPRGELRATVLISVKNYGKGPALKTMVGAGFTADKVDDSTQSQCNLIFPFVGLRPTWSVGTSDTSVLTRQHGNILFPNVPFVQGEDYSMDKTSAAGLSGKIVYVVGCIVYQDQFTNPHWTKFCYETREPLRDNSAFDNLAVCNTNNYTDDVDRR